jgi:hypothetical protein
MSLVISVWATTIPIPIPMTIPGRPEVAANEGATVVFGVLGVLISGFAVGYGIRAWWRDGNRIPMYFMLGGLLATAFEPLLDMAAGVWYPATGGIVAFEAAGTRIPVWVPLFYIWIIGGQAYLCWRAFERKASPRDLWKLALFIAVVDTVTESFGCGLMSGVYGYFGQQPLNPYGFPLWYPVVNTVAPMLGGALFYVLRNAVASRGEWMLTLTVPVGWAMACAGAGFPVWMSLHSDWGIVGAHVACAFTLLLSYYSMIVIFVITRTPGYEPRATAQARATQGAAR